MMYWTRMELKNAAKETMRRSYWYMFVASLVLVVVTGVSTSVNVNINLGSVDGSAGMFLLPFLGIFGLFSAAFVIAISVFVAGPIEVGVRRFYITNTLYGNDSLNFVFSGFRGEQYLGNVLVLFMKSLFVFLWSLLFVVPGIIKSYEYRFVAYIVAENPGIDYKTALATSREMTYGHKGAMFVLDLSVIGWFLLGGLLCGIGVLFVYPYYDATYAQLYLRLKSLNTPS